MASLGLESVLFLVGTGVLHLLYTESLLRRLRAGDLTVVYPLARGTGPLLSFCGAVLLLHEHPSLLAAAGAVLVTFGILLASGGFAALRDSQNHAGLRGASRPAVQFRATPWSMVSSVKTLLISPFL